MKLPIYVCALLVTGTLILSASCGKVSKEAQTSGVTNGTSTPSTPALITRKPSADGVGGAPLNAGSADAGGTLGSSPANASYGNSPASESYQPLEIPSGTRVSVRLQSPISSASAQPGDRFHAVLDSPIQADGQTVARSGAEVIGRVVAAEHSGRLEHPGMLQLELSSIRAEGREVAISTSRVTARGASHKKRNLGWIGGGAGGGALLGGLLGGGKGALIGGLAGAGAGTATAAATGKHDVAFNVEHQLTFQLRQQVEIR
jgi:hypothetical protein